MRQLVAKILFRIIEAALAHGDIGVVAPKERLLRIHLFRFVPLCQCPIQIAVALECHGFPIKRAASALLVPESAARIAALSGAINRIRLIRFMMRP